MTPQYWPPPAGMQSVGLQVGSGGVAQTPATPRPPHVWPIGQAPQSTVLPQPSPTLPQYWPLESLQANGGHEAGTQMLASIPVPHDCDMGQLPQSMVLP